jgi:signal transduction histidine kinase
MQRASRGAILDALANMRSHQSESSTMTSAAPTHRLVQRLVEALEFGVLILGRDQEIEYSNEAALLLLGISSIDELPARWKEVREGLDAQLSENSLRLADCPSLELDLADDPRHAHKLRLELFPIEEEENEGLIVLIRDRDMSEALETDLRLAARYRGLNSLFRATAHDLKAPFNAIMINLELLRESLMGTPTETPLRERQERYLNVLQSELSRLLRSLQVLLTQSMTASEQQQTFDLRELLMDLITLITPQAKQQHVRMQYSLPEQQIWMLGSSDWLNQALLNITINALEAMPEGGELSVEVKSWPGRAEVIIGDSGPGILPHIQENIWKMHYTTKQQGTGIGLYVSRNAVESHGGQIDLKSEPGQGTKFILTLPVLK